MAWKMDSHGNWTQTSGTGSKPTSSNSGQKSGTTVTDRGNTSDTNSGIKSSTDDKTDELKYAEEARFTLRGDYQIQRGGYINVRNGVADRWKGEWLILETSHSISARGYETEGLVARMPYYEKPKETSSGDSGNASSGSGSSSSGNSGQQKPPSSGNSGSSGGTWTMSPDGTWHKK